MAGAFASGRLAAGDLTEPEAALVDAALAHRWWEPVPGMPEEITEPPQDADWGIERTVRAHVLYQLLTGKGRPSSDGKAWDFEPRAVRVRGVRIVGHLDLEAATLRCPLALVGCWLDHEAEPVLMAEATAPAIRMIGCWMPAGVEARQLTTHADVDLSRCRIQSEVGFMGGRIGGQLNLSGGKFRNQDGPALNADGLRVDQDMFCGEGFEADGEVRLIGGHIGGQLDMSGGKFRNQDGAAVNADGLRVDQDVFCGEGFEADGEVSLAGGRIGGYLNLSGGKFRNTDGSALNADGLQVDQDILCGEGFEADGEVSLAGGHIGGNLSLTAGKFRNQGGSALVAYRLSVDKDVFCHEGLEAEGEVSFAGGHIGGQLNLSGGKFRNTGGSALNADGLQVDQDMLCQEGFEAYGEVLLRSARIGGILNLTEGKFRNQNNMALNAERVRVDQDMFCREAFEADGEVRLRGGHIGGQLVLTAGKFRNQSGSALSADRLNVDQDIFCREGFEADGEVRLAGVHVGGLDLRGGTFRNEAGQALFAERIRVDSTLHWEPEEVAGEVSFLFGSVGVWVDDASVLGIPLDLHRLRYDALFPMPPEVSAAERVAWLGLDPWGYSPQPYSQLASVYRAEGHDRAARQVLIASQTRRRWQPSGWRGFPGRAWGGLLWATVGYGYRPWLALLWLMVLIVGGSLVVDALPAEEFVEGTGAPGFNSLLYTVDVLLPFIDLGYGKWVAVGVAQIVTVVLVVLGWVLATAVIAAFAGVLRRGD